LGPASRRSSVNRESAARQPPGQPTPATTPKGESATTIQLNDLLNSPLTDLAMRLPVGTGKLEECLDPKYEGGARFGGPTLVVHMCPAWGTDCSRLERHRVRKVADLSGSDQRTRVAYWHPCHGQGSSRGSRPMVTPQ
jgi:hypothetical protein